MDKNGIMCAAAALLVSAAAVAAETALETFICHRGESHDAPENTLPAYKMAVERGFGFECDIYLSKDGRVFTFHDRTLARTSGGANTNTCNNATPRPSRQTARKNFSTNTRHGNDTQRLFQRGVRGSRLFRAAFVFTAQPGRM